MSTPKEIADAKRKYPLTEQIGATGLRKSSGVILEEFETILRGPKGREIFYEMASNDAVIGSILYSMKSLVRSVEWSVVPADQDNFDPMANVVPFQQPPEDEPDGTAASSEPEPVEKRGGDRVDPEELVRAMKEAAGLA